MNGTETSVPFPPQPWRLRGSACVSLWRVAQTELADAGARPLRLGGQLLLVTVWATYTSGTLAYDELAVAVVQRARPGPSVSVGPIWVSDAVAAAGGRALWRIPKVLGEFTAEVGSRRFVGRLSQHGQVLAALRFSPGLTLPGRLPLTGYTLQTGPDGCRVRTRCTARGRLVLGRAAWDFPAGGPLGFLHGRRPLASARLTSLRLTFGA